MSSDCNSCLRDDCAGLCCIRCGNARGVEYDGWGDGGTWCQACLDEVRARGQRMLALPKVGEGIAFAFVTRDAAEGWQRASERSPAWVWVTPSAGITRGTLDDGLVHAHATVLLNHALVTIRCEGNALELSTTLPAWSQSQQRRWVEQWVASQSDAAVAAFEAAEEGR